MTIERAAFCTASVTSLVHFRLESAKFDKQKDEGENTYETYFRGIPHIFGELSTSAGAF